MILVKFRVLGGAVVVILLNWGVIRNEETEQDTRTRRQL